MAATLPEGSNEAHSCQSVQHRKFANLYNSIGDSRVGQRKRELADELLAADKGNLSLHMP